MTEARPDPFDVLEVTFGPDARPVRLDGGTTIVRTLGRHDSADDAVLRRGPVPAAALDEVLADARQRFAHPDAMPRVVLRDGPELRDALAAREDLRSRRLDVVLLDDPESLGAPRPDLALTAPTDPRTWHALTVLRRHAGPGHEDRSRGALDERLRWEVDGLRTLVSLGRARVLRADRFGTPVGAGVLSWEPRIDVGDEHAGLAVLHSHVVHPAHRRLGVATSLVASLVAAHLTDFPRARIAAVATAGVVPEGLAGLRHHGSLLVVEPAHG